MVNFYVFLWKLIFDRQSLNYGLRLAFFVELQNLRTSYGCPIISVGPVAHFAFVAWGIFDLFAVVCFFWARNILEKEVELFLYLLAKIKMSLGHLFQFFNCFGLADFAHFWKIRIKRLMWKFQIAVIRRQILFV